MEQEAQARALFLEPHPDYPAYLLVNSFDPLYVHALKETIGEYRAIHKLKLDKLFEAADEEGFGPIVYAGNPDDIFDFLKRLDDPYPHDLSVTLKHFQLRGYNYTKSLDSAIINWSTGTGKSVYAVARAKHLLLDGEIDKVVVLSKSHNKKNWQRTFERIGALQAVRDDECVGSPSMARERRAELYKDNDIFIINYEKMRYRPEREPRQTLVGGRKRPAASGDGQELQEALRGQRVLWVWDEMPSKMKSMQTAWYKGAQKLLKVTKHNYQIELTATKVERDPENVYVCTKILDKNIWPSISTFRSHYAKSMSNFSPWQVASWDKKKLPEIGMRLAHITHVADKYSDPEIRDEFPVDHWEDVLIDMSPQDRKLYDHVKQATLEDKEVLTFNKLIPLQLVCNNPLLLESSGSELAARILQTERVTDAYCNKLLKLRDILDEIDSKVVIFTKFTNLGTKMLMPYLAAWGQTFVIYDGNANKKQEAQDRFREDDRIKIFLSSDAGSDSIDLEQATTVINYDLPDNHSTLIQRVNRISRLTSTAEHVFYMNLIMADTLEEKKLKRLHVKRQYEEAIDTDLVEQSELLTETNVDSIDWLLA
jgi:SNF2 family DNA or RNA helicase